MYSHISLLATVVLVFLPFNTRGTSVRTELTMSKPEDGATLPLTLVEGSRMEELEAREVDTQRSSSRTRTLTEKGLQWQISEKRKGLKIAVSAWRRQAGHLESLLSDSTDTNLLKQERSQLEVRNKEIITAYDSLNDISSVELEGTDNDTFDVIQGDHYSLLRRISETIRSINSEKIENGSVRSRSHHSQGSVRSNASKASSKKVDIATEAAGLRTKLKYLDMEASKKAELERLQNLEMTLKAELERFQTLKDLEVAESKLKVLAQLEIEQSEVKPDLAPDGMNEYLEDFVNKHVPYTDSGDANDLIEPVAPPRATTSQLNPQVPEFAPRDQGIPTDIHSHDLAKDNPIRVHSNTISSANLTTNNVSVPVTQPFQDNASQPMLELARVFSDHTKLSRLPVPEPSIFMGDPLKYPDWKVTFEMLIEHRGIPTTERIHYLRKYIGGVAKEAIEGYFLVTSPYAYADARTLLEERYGNPFVISNVFRDRLESWPKIPARDGTALRKFSDFLRQCSIAMESIPNLHVLNDERENRKMLAKLPDWLISRWGRKVADSKMHAGIFPGFRQFQEFVMREAEIACDPITSLQAVKPHQPNESKRPERAYTRFGQTDNASSFATNTDLNDQNKSTSCVLCRRPHDLELCNILISKSLFERKTFIRENNLCFGCLKPGHPSAMCKNRSTCKICSRQHPTPLHGDFRESGDFRKFPDRKIESKFVPKQNTSDDSTKED